MLCLSRPMGFGGRRGGEPSAGVFCPLQSNPVGPVLSPPGQRSKLQPQPVVPSFGAVSSSAARSQVIPIRLGIVSIEETSSRYVHETRRETRPHMPSSSFPNSLATHSIHLIFYTFNRCFPPLHSFTHTPHLGSSWYWLRFFALHLDRFTF